MEGSRTAGNPESGFIWKPYSIMDIGPYISLILVFFSVSVALLLHKFRDTNTFVDNRKSQIRDVLFKVNPNEAVDYYVLIQHIGKFDLSTNFLKERLKILHPYFEQAIDEIIKLRECYNKLQKTTYYTILVIGPVILSMIFFDIFNKKEITNYCDFFLRVGLSLLCMVGYGLLLFIMDNTSLSVGNYSSEENILNYTDWLLEKDYSVTFKDRIAIINSEDNQKKESYLSRYESINNCLGSILKEIDNPKILDIGCGDGVFEKDYIKEGINVLGIDVSGKSIKNALLDKKKLHTFKEISLSEFLSIPRSEVDKFDIIILSDMLEHFVAPVLRLKELKKLLKKDGHILATLPNIKSSYNLDLAKQKPLLGKCLSWKNKCCHVWTDTESNKIFPHFLYSKAEVNRIFRKSFSKCDLQIHEFGPSNQCLFTHAIVRKF